MKLNILALVALVLVAQVSWGYSINEARNCLFGNQKVYCKSPEEMLRLILPRWKVLISKDATLATTGETARVISALVESVDNKQNSTPTETSVETSGKKVLVKLQLSEEDLRSASPLCESDSCVLFPAAQQIDFLERKTGFLITKMVVSPKQAPIAISPDKGLVLVFENISNTNAGVYSVIEARTKKVLFHKIGVDASMTKDGRFITIVNRTSESSEKNMSSIYDAANGFKKVAEMKTSVVVALKTSDAMGVFCRSSQGVATECIPLK